MNNNLKKLWTITAMVKEMVEQKRDGIPFPLIEWCGGNSEKAWDCLLVWSIWYSRGCPEV
jgi:hypothetical protein